MLMVLLLGVLFLYVSVNFAEQLDHLLAKKPPITSIVKYYAYQVPYLCVLLAPVAGLLSAFFALGDMSRFNEFLALKAGGVNPARTVMPVFIVGLLITAVATALNQSVVPHGMREAHEVRAVEINKSRVTRARTYAENLSFMGAGNAIYYMRRIDARRNQASGISVLFCDTSGHVIRRVDARNGTYKGGKWTLGSISDRTFPSADYTLPTGESFSRYSRKIYPEVQESPFEFLTVQKELTELSVSELAARRDKLRKAGMTYAAEIVESGTRFSFPLMNLILLLLAVPISVSMR